MKTVSQREFRNHSAAIMDAVESGETFVVTRNGVEVAEVRPARPRRRPLTAEQLVARYRRLPTVDYEAMRKESDAFFGATEFIGGDDDPFERRRG
jgi:prevent-host-death family protein